MSIELTPDQLKALADEESPVRVVGGDRTYVLVSQDVYDRLQGLLNLSEPTDMEEIAELRQFGKLAGWDNPEEDLYEDFRTR
jgi:hypothetical protein